MRKFNAYEIYPETDLEKEMIFEIIMAAPFPYSNLWDQNRHRFIIVKSMDYLPDPIKYFEDKFSEMGSVLCGEVNQINVDENKNTIESGLWIYPETEDDRLNIDRLSIDNDQYIIEWDEESKGYHFNSEEMDAVELFFKIESDLDEYGVDCKLEIG